MRPTTVDSYRSALTRHLIPAFGQTPIDESTTEKIRIGFASYGDRTPTARAHADAVLKAIMGQAIADELVARTPCRIKSGGRTRVKREPEVLTLPELLTLAQAMPRQHQALTLVAGLCGLRFGEAVALRSRDVDLERGIIHVTRTAVRSGGAKSTGPLKTDAGRRTVAMPQAVIDALARYLEELRCSPPSATAHRTWRSTIGAPRRSGIAGSRTDFRHRWKLLELPAHRDAAFDPWPRRP